jgi:hypothetical protein
VLVNNGIYNALLGSQTALDPDIFGASLLYLEVEVEGEALSPRQRITSVPFSINTERIAGSRFEIETRPIQIPAGASKVTVWVSFNQAFNSPPQVMVTFGGILGIGEVSGIQATGFDLTFAPSPGGTSGTFTYQAFGN